MPRVTKQERRELRTKALAHLKKQGALDAYVPLDEKNRPDVEVISTGSLVLDKVLGVGGYPRGRIVEIFGPESVGKSTLGIAACIEAQQEGGFATYIDFEHAIHMGYAQAMGLDLGEDAFAFFQPNFFEQGAQVAYDYIKVVKSDIVVVDSVTAMIPKKVYESGPQDPSKGMGVQARLMSSFLNLISKEISKTDTCLVFINQMRANIKLSQYDAGPDWTTSGGKSLPYYATMRLRLRPGKIEYANLMNEMTGQKERIPVSNFVRAEGFKNKVGFPKRKGEFVIRYGEGVDNVRSIIEVAEHHKIIKKSGSYYTFRKEGEAGYFNKQGVEQTRKYLLENSDVFMLLMEEVKEQLAQLGVRKITQDLKDEDLHVEEAQDPEEEEEEAPQEVEVEDEDFEALLGEEKSPEPLNTSKPTPDESLLSVEDIEGVVGE